jgi:hypothetical protein
LAVWALPAQARVTSKPLQGENNSAFPTAPKAAPVQTPLPVAQPGAAGVPGAPAADGGSNASTASIPDAGQAAGVVPELHAQAGAAVLPPAPVGWLVVISALSLAGLALAVRLVLKT